MAPRKEGEVREPCLMPIEVTETMSQPIFVYYQLENFYQNHRRYVKSRDYKQLMGWDGEDEDWTQQTEDDVRSTCDPIVTNDDLKNMGITKYVYTPPSELSPDESPFEYSDPDNLDLIGSQVATPCGLIAKSLFNDTFALY